MFGMDKLSPNLVRANDAFGTLRFATKGFFYAFALPFSRKVCLQYFSAVSQKVFL